MTDIEAIKALAKQLTIEPDPDWKDEWERGFDAGWMAAGRELLKALGDPS